MSEEFLGGKVTLHCGDCAEILRGLPNDSFDSVVTDPPYALVSIVKRFGSANAAPAKGNEAYKRASAGFMGKTWDTGDVAFSVDFWTDAFRVLKPGGHVIAASGTRTYHRLAVAIEDAGFEIRDMVSWLYGSGFPKSHDVSKGIDRAAGAEREVVGIDPQAKRRNKTTSKFSDVYGVIGDAASCPITAPATPEAAQWQGWGTALKPACEPWVLARKPLIGTVAQNVLVYGTGALNIDACRVPSSTGQRPTGDGEWASDPNLCDLCAEHVGQSEKPLIQGTKASIATKRAVLTLNGKEETLRLDTARPDIGCSAGMTASDTAISSNTAASGKQSADLSPQDTKFTTSTRTGETTTSAICNSCGSPITSRSTNANTKQTTSAEPQRPQEPALTAPVGRWPANLIHDGSEEVVAGFPDREVNKPSGSSTGGVNVYGGGWTAGNAWRPDDGKGSAARFFYSAKADTEDRLGSKHPTVKPVDLMQYLCRLVTPPGGRILDPFAGTGTTGEAAIREGFRAVLIEREAEYQADIRRRMSLAAAGPETRAVERAKAKTKSDDFGGMFSAE